MSMLAMSVGELNNWVLSGVNRMSMLALSVGELNNCPLSFTYARHRDQQRGSPEATPENQPQQSIRSRHDPCTYLKRLGRRIGSYPHRNF